MKIYKQLKKEKVPEIKHFLENILISAREYILTTII